MTIDIEKAFNSVNHFILIPVLKQWSFVDEFIKRTKTLLKNEESHVVNGGKTTCYFKLQTGTRQGNSNSAYNFIFTLIKK